jgi:hypothetical protein
VDLGGDLGGEIPKGERRVQADDAPGATSADRDQIQVRTHLGVRKPEYPPGKLDQEALISQSDQASPMDAALRRILGPENAPRTPGHFLQNAPFLHHLWIKVYTCRS